MTLRRAAATALLLTASMLAVALAACGSSSSGSPRADAAADVAAADASDDAKDGATGIGIVEFSEAPDGGGTFYAAFSKTTPVVDSGCQVVDAGACTTTTCPPPPMSDAGAVGDAASAFDGNFPMAANPGILTVSGGVFGSGTELGPDKLGTYLYTSPATIFAPGDKLGVAGQGADIPGFATESVVAPPILHLTAPASPDGGSVTVSTTQPLTLSWTGGQAGVQMVVTATAIFTTYGSATTTCNWDSSTGTATVPSDALRPLAAENALTSGIVWYGLAETKFTTGTVDVTLSAYVPQGKLAAFQ
jgi:hypothetical protein